MKEKGESKPRQHTIDLSQMAVPIQVAQEKKPSPESPKPSTSEAEPSAEYITAGNSAQGSLKKPTSYRYQALLEDEFPLKKKLYKKSRTAINQAEHLKAVGSQFLHSEVWALPISG